MVKKTLILYKDSFTGLSTEIWWLAFITFINRAGTMVIPFLSLYLTDHLELSVPQVGWIMASFGLGSFLGSFLGGKLTDKVGYYKVMFWSLLLTGFLFIGLQFITTFWGFVGGVFITMVVADTFAMAFGFATIFSAKFGMEIVDKFGFDTNWYIMVVLSAIAIVLSYILKKKVNK